LLAKDHQTVKRRTLIHIQSLGRGFAITLKNQFFLIASSATSQVLITPKTCVLCGRPVGGAWTLSTRIMNALLPMPPAR